MHILLKARLMLKNEYVATVLRVKNGIAQYSTDVLAPECPVAIECNGISHAVMLVTPSDLEDFALGFALTEGIIDQPQQLYETQVDSTEQGFSIKLRIAGSCFARLKEKRRLLIGNTGCGICGTESLSHVLRPMDSIGPTQHLFDINLIKGILNELNSQQSLQHSTGATHAAAWFDRQGHLKFVREDVGRHNALDKVIGAARRRDQDNNPDGPLVVTSRASMEIVQKAIVAKAPCLIAVSAPTSMAVRLANQYGLCLIGFARENSFNVYTHAESLTGLHT